MTEQHKTVGARSIESYFGTLTQSESTIQVGILKSELEELLLQATVACNWPFDQFSNPRFRTIIHRGFPGHKCPGRNAMTALLKKKAIVVRAEIKERLIETNSRISLALDCWTSPNRWEFMGISPYSSV